MADPAASTHELTPLQLAFPPVFQGMIQKIQRLAYEQGEFENVEQIRSIPIYFIVYIASFISTAWRRWLQLDKSIHCTEGNPRFSRRNFQIYATISRCNTIYFSLLSCMSFRQSISW